ncbi:MAG TPA: YabP/YqfC family sporulation protein [Candidatus Protoclostridium stercorigallinarum]|uniref:YabP/YqfC family sporulation protein n=1 Tax=Candidatus Protoclostridium stercorigallinarum TaxID=2838741 RepID=A0A9D1PY61_9FIRM|nr:YabP/YqfC family sporulation protein [Candidatus Protoclostridium stercorigallinarum]
MSFFDDIRRCVAGGSKYGYYIVLFGGEAAYIGGVTRIAEISGERIVLLSEKRVLTLCGEELGVDGIERGGAIVRGKIKRIEEGE